MLLATFAALLLLADPAPAAVPPSVPAAAPTTAPAPAATDPVIARLEALMETWRGKSGDPLRGKLGLSQSSKTAADGEAVFWLRRAEAVGCGIDASGQMRCLTAGADAVCVLAIGFDKDGKVKTWRISGAPMACQMFVDELTPS